MPAARTVQCTYSVHTRINRAEGKIRTKQEEAHYIYAK